MAEVKLKFKESWVEVKSGKILQTLVTEETLHIDDDLDIEIMTEYYKNERIGSSTVDGVCHIVSIVEDEGLSKEEMFNFILNNKVTLHPDGTYWTKFHEDGTEEKILIDYNVSINGHGMSGYDLVSAINYYVKEIQEK